MKEEGIIDVRIKGGNELSGSVDTPNSKNGSVALLCGSLLNKGTTTLHGIPKIEDVLSLIGVMKCVGVSVEWIDKNSVRIKPPKKYSFESLEKNKEELKKIRSGIMLIGPFLHIFKDFEFPYSGGCKMGERTISAHKYGFEELGVEIDTMEDFYKISVKEFKKGKEVVLYEKSDTATTNLLLGASKIDGETTLRFPSFNYSVLEVYNLLKAFGVDITSTASKIIIKGNPNIDKDIEYYNGEDPIIAMTFITAGIVTNSNITVKKAPINFLSLELEKLKKMGLKFEISSRYLSKNGHTKLADVTIFKSELKALPDKIHPLPYPGINVDNLPFFIPIATQASGESLIHDWMWENRAEYFVELNKLGGDIKLLDPHRVVVKGKTELVSNGVEIECPKALRPSVVLLLGMLASKGESLLKNIYSINRGYEDIFGDLKSIGADIDLLK